MSTTFYPAVALAEISTGKPLRKDVNGWPLLFVREGESIHAFYNLCPHLGARMNAARIERGTLICPLHHARFALATGLCVDSERAGAPEGLPPLTRFATRLVGDYVEVALPPGRGSGV
jgi:anthranilate 1,2-dioxygenase ferredoxin component